jgi:hypothetical protein
MTKQKENLIEFFNYLFIHTEMYITEKQTRNSLIEGFMQEKKECRSTPKINQKNT